MRIQEASKIENNSNFIKILSKETNESNKNALIITAYKE